MSHADKIRLLALTNTLLTIGGIYYVIASGIFYWLLIGLVSWIFVMIFSVNIALHRFISHGSFQTGPRRAKFLKYISIVSAFGSPLSWAAMHRYHHKTSGSEHDNQSPKNIGIIRAWLTMYDNIKVPPRMIKDVIADKDFMFIHKNYFKFLLGYAILLYLINPLIGIFCFSMPAALAYQGAGAFAVIPHNKKFGYTVVENIDDDDSVNSPLASLLSVGEGWHNWHHTYPRDYRHGHKWWEIDPPAWVIEKVFKYDR